MVEAAGEDERELAAEMAAAFLNENLPEAIFGAPKAGAGQWASLVRLVNPIQGSTLDQVQLEQNEAAFRWAASLFAVCTDGKTDNRSCTTYRDTTPRLTPQQQEGNSQHHNM